jgi:hypothetical protein
VFLKLGDAVAAADALRDAVSKLERYCYTAFYS